jgi:hypothetical protein
MFCMSENVCSLSVTNLLVIELSSKPLVPCCNQGDKAMQTESPSLMSLRPTQKFISI